MKENLSLLRNEMDSLKRLLENMSERLSAADALISAIEEAEEADDLPADDLQSIGQPAAGHPADDQPADDQSAIGQPADDLPPLELQELEPTVQETPEPERPVPDVPEPEMSAREESAGARTETPEPEARQGKSLFEDFTISQAWRTDRPGAHVSDIRSAVTLNDRVLFINTLFNGDPVAFQDTMLAINAMHGMDELLDYLKDKDVGWDMDSDIVYRFMMAARRKLD